jgi:hypothetical protein
LYVPPLTRLRHIGAIRIRTLTGVLPNSETLTEGVIPTSAHSARGGICKTIDWSIPLGTSINCTESISFSFADSWLAWLA